MKKRTPGNSNDAWLERFFAGTSAETKPPAFRPTPSPSEQKAAETTRASRTMTETATDQRQAAAARLKAARLARDAEAGASAARKTARKGGEGGKD